MHPEKMTNVPRDPFKEDLDDILADAQSTEGAHGTKTPGKAALASFLGSTLEYYDFFIFGTAAALVFPKLFFETSNPTVAAVASFMTFGAAYIARPLGGLVMGHFGDRIGRKNVLLVTLAVMGLASTLIGLLPTFHQIGVWAPILLVTLRLAQGFTAGAEAAGAATLTVEHSPEGRRGLFTSSVMAGYAAGNVLASLVFIPVALLPEEQMLSWGWRVPFLLSLVVLGVAYFVRTHLDETPVFKEAQEEELVEGLPAGRVIRHQWKDILRVMVSMMFSLMQTLFGVFALAYGVEQGIPRPTMLTIAAIAVGASLFTIPLCGALSDRIGRRKTIFIAHVGVLVSLAFYFWTLSTGNVALAFLGALLNMGVFYSFWNGVWPVYFAEMFAAPVRYTGSAMGNQLGLLVAGFAPAIAAAIQGEGTWGWIPVLGFAGAVTVAAFIAVFSSRETAHVPIDQLGIDYASGRPVVDVASAATRLRQPSLR